MHLQLPQNLGLASTLLSSPLPHPSQRPRRFPSSESPVSWVLAIPQERELGAVGEPTMQNLFPQGPVFMLFEGLG